MGDVTPSPCPVDTKWFSWALMTKRQDKGYSLWSQRDRVAVFVLLAVSACPALSQRVCVAGVRMPWGRTRAWSGRTRRNISGSWSATTTGSRRPCSPWSTGRSHSSTRQCCLSRATGAYLGFLSGHRVWNWGLWVPGSCAIRLFSVLALLAEPVPVPFCPSWEHIPFPAAVVGGVCNVPFVPQLGQSVFCLFPSCIPFLVDAKPPSAWQDFIPNENGIRRSRGGNCWCWKTRKLEIGFVWDRT